jgi:cyclic pyranopterin monophosphate synthase
MSKNSFTHLDARGRARMVDVSAKPATARLARAQARVLLNPTTLRALRSNRLPKGDVWALARAAGILAAKRTGEFVPLAHPLAISQAAVDFAFEKRGLRVETLVKTTGPTGVELEALMAAWGAALTVYDMIKALQRDARITDVLVLEKTGGKGRFVARRA